MYCRGLGEFGVQGLGSRGFLSKKRATESPMQDKEVGNVMKTQRTSGLTRIVV